MLRTPAIGHFETESQTCSIVHSYILATDVISSRVR